MRPSERSAQRRAPLSDAIARIRLSRTRTAPFAPTRRRRPEGSRSHAAPRVATSARLGGTRVEPAQPPGLGIAELESRGVAVDDQRPERAAARGQRRRGARGLLRGADAPRVEEEGRRGQGPADAGAPRGDPRPPARAHGDRALLEPSDAPPPRLRRGGDRPREGAAPALAPEAAAAAIRGQRGGGIDRHRRAAPGGALVQGGEPAAAVDPQGPAVAGDAGDRVPGAHPPRDHGRGRARHRDPDLGEGGDHVTVEEARQPLGPGGGQVDAVAAEPGPAGGGRVPLRDPDAGRPRRRGASDRRVDVAVRALALPERDPHRAPHARGPERGADVRGRVGARPVVVADVHDHDATEPASEATDQREGALRGPPDAAGGRELPARPRLQPEVDPASQDGARVARERQGLLHRVADHGHARGARQDGRGREGERAQPRREARGIDGRGLHAAAPGFNRAAAVPFTHA